MTVSPGVARNGSCASAFVATREGCRRRHTPPSVRFLGRRVYAGLVVVLVSAMHHGLKPERVQMLARGPGDRPPHARTLASVVVGPLRAELVLERSSRPVHAAVVPKDDALVLVRELWGRTARPAFGVAQVSVSDHHPDCLERVRYVRLAPSPAEDAGRHRQGGGVEPWPHHRTGGKNENNGIL